MKASIVHTHINAFYATAIFTLPTILFRACDQTKNLFYQLIIYTLSMWNTY